MTEKEKTALFNPNLSRIIIISLIILIAFFLFSTAFYPFISSDDALNVLIANDYSLPHDLYCWGQDRGGTLIPLISQLFIKPFGIPAYVAVSLSSYLILTLGFIGFSTLLKDKRLLILLALFWFFPFQRFLQLNVFPIGMGYSLLGFSILFIRNIDFRTSLFRSLPNVIRIGIVGFIWLFAVWCSDLVFVTLITLLGTHLLFTLVHLKKKKANNWQYLFAQLFILAGIFLIIRKAKSYATGNTEQFMYFNSFSNIGKAFLEVFDQSTKVLLGSEDFVLTIGAWIILSLLVIGIYLLIHYRKAIFKFQNFAINFFLFETIATLAVIFLSHWVLLNEMGRWYFVAPYVSFGILFILLIEQTGVLTIRKKYIGAILIFILLGSSSVSNVLHFSDGKYKPMTRTISELNELGQIGVIADYWNAYRMSIVNPDKVKATPKEAGGVRNEKLISEVFNQPRIFISRDMWMDEFPDSLIQFGIPLIRSGEPLFIAGSNICEYEVVNRKREFELSKLKYPSSVFNGENQSIVLNSNQNELQDQMLVYGPYISILPGKYYLKIHVSPESKNLVNNALHFDISHDFGNKSSGFQSLTHLKFVSDSTESFFYKEFLTQELMQHTEFRLLVKKPVDFEFLKFELVPFRIEKSH